MYNYETYKIQLYFWVKSKMLNLKQIVDIIGLKPDNWRSKWEKRVNGTVYDFTSWGLYSESIWDGDIESHIINMLWRVSAVSGQFSQFAIDDDNHVIFFFSITAPNWEKVWIHLDNDLMKRVVDLWATISIDYYGK